MSDFMQPSVIQDDFIEYEWHGEAYAVPADVEGVLPDDAVITERYSDKWFGRLSAPGYLDCTEWSGPFDTEKEAMDNLIELYDLKIEEE